MAKSLPSYDSEFPNEYNLSYCLLSSQLLFIYLLTLDTYYINILIIVKGTLHFWKWAHYTTPLELSAWPFFYPFSQSPGLVVTLALLA